MCIRRSFKEIATYRQSIKMRFAGLFLVLSSLIAFNLAINKKPKRLEITAENQWEFGVPIGTILKLDKHTRLYQPPHISDDFTPDQRLQVMWNDRNTYNNYCKVGPSIDSAHFFYNFWWHQWCKNATSHDICCKGHQCSCNMLKANCACLSSEHFEYWERKKEVDWNNLKRIWETIKKPIKAIYTAIKGTKKGSTNTTPKDAENPENPENPEN